ncbi:DNA replication regulator sld2 [Lambiella insularis]|nr:DNA replication regulator sld2 [Lambiella insularis]
MSLPDLASQVIPPYLGDTSSQACDLRAELKAWESSFAAANGGRKAGREDIKQVPEIAQKYKEYSKLRYRLEASQPDPSSPPAPNKKRKRLSAECEHFSASQQHPSRSSKHQAHPSAVDLYELPASHLTPNPTRTSIGPTPQKNGLVLGLFDLISPHRTPSKLDLAAAAQPFSPGQLATPSKRRHTPSTVIPAKHTQTPQSARKRLSSATGSLLTPSARRTTHCTPTSARTGAPQAQLDDTPEFLRRSAPLFPRLPSTNANTTEPQGGDSEKGFWSPVAVRLPRKPIGRGLSALVKGLRAMEEEKLDEELELLREMEGEEMAGPAPRTKAGGMTGAKGSRVLVGDSQAVEMPLGADGEGDESSEEEETAKGRNGKPLRVWKKKGQKRSTRRVVMKPNVGKWKPEKEWVGGEDEGDGVVQETQVGEARVDKERDEELVDQEGSGYEDVLDGGKSAKKGGEGAETKKKPPKKISATAHANFRALKIKNKQSKGKRGGRFGRKK